MSEKLPQYLGLKPAANILPDGTLNWNGWRMYNASFFNLLESRTNSNRPNIIIITGEQGSGKTYAGCRISEIMDPEFKILPMTEDGPSESRVIFGREHLSYLLNESKHVHRGTALVLDESQFSMGSRTWQKKDQQALVDQMAALRSRGFIFIVVALGMSMVDSTIRRFVLTYHLVMDNRGKVSIYQIFTPRFNPTQQYRRRLGRLLLRLPFNEECSFSDCLNCEWLYNENKKTLYGKTGTCMVPRAIYEKNKRTLLRSESHKRTESKVPKNPISTAEVPMITEQSKDEIDQHVQTALNTFGHEIIQSDQGIIDLSALEVSFWQHCHIHLPKSKMVKVATRLRRFLRKQEKSIIKS